MWFTDSEVFFKKPVLKHFAILASVFNNFSGVQAGSFFKKRLQHRCFPANIAKFLTTTFLKNICERLLLKSEYIKKWNQRKQVFCKNGVLEYLQENTCTGVSFLIKLQAIGLQLYWKVTWLQSAQFFRNLMRMVFLNT